LTDAGELPLGVHPAPLSEVLNRFGAGSVQRRAVALRLERVYRIARASGHLSRFVVFGSFVTAKLEPADVDVFLLMENTFDASQLTGEARFLFDHSAAQTRFGVSVFWLRRLAALEGEVATINYWQIKPRTINSSTPPWNESAAFKPRSLTSAVPRPIR
jgi:hypothetical protein